MKINFAALLCMVVTFDNLFHTGECRTIRDISSGTTCVRNWWWLFAICPDDSTSSSQPDSTNQPTDSNKDGIIDKNVEIEGKTTVYWDCCKPACSWPGNGPSVPVNTCAANGETVIGSNDASGCNDGPSYSCNNHSPWAINGTLSYGFAALNGLPGEGIILCCKCYHLSFTSSTAIGKSMIVQVTNIGTGFGEAHFNLQIPGGGIGSNPKGCTNQWGLPEKNWGRQYGGVTGISQCDKLPAPLQDGCRWRFDWFNFADNPSVKFREVDCPDELIQRTGCRA